jgi:hypothetical protein
MQPDTSVPLTAPAALWTGRALSALVALFLVLDAIVKLIPIAAVGEAMQQLGYSNSVALARGLGVLTLVCVALYLSPRTSVLGAILLTGLFGGAMASHLRVGNPLFSHFLFGAYLGVVVWGSLWPRDARLRSLIPWRT